jgi:hypothetical protein
MEETMLFTEVIANFLRPKPKPEARPDRRVTMEKLKEAYPQLAELVEEILNDDESLSGFLPNAPVRAGEKALGIVPPSTRRLFSLSEFYGREGAQAGVDRRYAPPAEVGACIIRGSKAHAKCAVTTALFWWTIRTELNLWSAALGLREGWMVVEEQVPVGPWGPAPR